MTRFLNLFTAAVMVALSLTSNPARAQFIEPTTDAPPTFANAVDARLPGNPWPTISGVFQTMTASPADHVDAYRVCNPYSVSAVMRWYPETDYTPQNIPLATNTFTKLDGQRPFWTNRSVDDQRSLSTGLWQSGQCGSIATATPQSRFTADSSGAASPSGNFGPSDYNYDLMRLPSRRLRPDRLMTLPQQEINRLDDPRIQTIECDQVEAMTYRYDNPTISVDPGEVLRHIVRLGTSCVGVQVRVYANNLTGLAQLTPAGNLVESGKYNVWFNNHPGYYPAPQNFQNGRDHGAALLQSLQAGNYLAMGLTVRDDGTINVPGCPLCIYAPESVGEVRGTTVTVIFARPSMAWADEPVQITPEGVSLRWTASRQCLGASVTLFGKPVNGERLDLFAVGDEDIYWSQSAPAGTVFTATMSLQPGVASEGEVITYEVMPLCAGLYGDDEPQPSMVLTGSTTAVVADEGSPTSSDLELSTYPNPATTGLTATWNLDTPHRVTVTVYSVLGRQVVVVHDGPMQSGEARLQVDVGALAPGVYLLRVVQENGAVVSRRFSVVR